MIIDRFIKYMDFNGLNDNQVTVDCHLSVGLIGKARKGKSDLGRNSIEKILKAYPDLSRAWLLTGEGPMLKDASTSMAPADSENVSIDRQAWEVIRSQAASLERKDKQMDELLSMLREEMKRGDDADYRGHAAMGAAAD